MLLLTEFEADNEDEVYLRGDIGKDIVAPIKNKWGENCLYIGFNKMSNCIAGD